jgi:hypothetical protein
VFAIESRVEESGREERRGERCCREVSESAKSAVFDVQY